jgi:hypothetical protein
MTKHGRVTIESSVHLAVDNFGMGYDGDTFYVSLGGIVIARRGNPWDEKRAREWFCTEPGWSVVESNRPKRSGIGNLHFTYDPPSMAS